jgi:predicted peptidase
MRAACAFLLLVALAGCERHEDWALGAGQHAERLHRTVIRTVDAELLLYLPPGFDPHGNRRYPLLIFLHGSGESGHNIEAVKTHGPPKLVAAGQHLPFIVASPQAREEHEGFDPTTLDAMLDELLERLPIDPDRVYLTGLSMGGMWTYGWASMDPGRFAAIAPISGEWGTEAACALKDVPVWAFHGAKDDVVPIAADRAMVDAINQCGGDARLSVYDNAGHGVWGIAYGEPQLFAWLLAHKRKHARP